MNAVITNPVNLVLIIIGTFLGLSLSLFLLLNKSAKNKANKYLGALLLMLTSYLFTAFFYRFDLLEQFPHIIGITIVITFLIGPLGYFYVRACTQKDFRFRPILLLHFLPFFFDFLFNIPDFMESGPEKIEKYHHFIAHGIREQQPFWMIMLKAIQGITYFILSAQLIFQYRKHLGNSASSIDNVFHRWLLVFIIILGLPVFSLLGYVLVDYQRILILIVVLAIFFFILAVYIAALVKPELFHAFPHQMSLPASSEVQKQKYETSKLQTTQKDKYLDKIIAYVAREKPYQSPELTLSELAELVNIPAHYVSQVINEKLNVNFLDFINGYRVKAAQELLIDPKMSHYTILSVAYEAGFNAKSTFYSVFKKQTGMTPSQFRKKAKVAA